MNILSPWRFPASREFILKAPLVALLAVFAADHCHATGFYGPGEYLSEGGKNVDASPEFYWDVEVKRMAKEFHPPEKRAALPPKSAAVNVPGEQKSSVELFSEATAAADLADYAAALGEGRIKPPDPKKAAEQHAEARAFLATDGKGPSATLPEEFASEFADYDRGALAYRLGNWAEARKIWEGLLQRPAAERHYRSVWAAFMLGKAALKSAAPQEAPQWFQQTRALARDGFADSAGLAADSYGWEGRAEWKQGRPEKAAPLFLTQLALGDESAVVSLKALIPDRQPVDGTLNYGPEADDVRGWNDDQKRAKEAEALAALRVAAADPLLRRLVTAHILATCTARDVFSDGSADDSQRRSRWLSVSKEIKLTNVAGTEYLGWIAYAEGKYQEAAHWLEMAAGDPPAACWLRAKLQRREGKLDEAAKSMALAWGSIHELKNYTGWKENSQEGSIYIYRGSEGGWTFSESASGDLGALRLTRGDFVQAMDTFRRGGLWTDAAFVAERVLTASELKAYVDALPAPPKPQKSEAGKNAGLDIAASADYDDSPSLRNLLGRRLVREERCDEALHYLPPPHDKTLRTYMEALKTGADGKLSKRDRAHALFTAAWLARHSGMEMMGTEVAPDGTVSGGEFQNTDLARERSSGKYTETRWKEGKEQTSTLPIVLKPSKPELQRLANNKITPDVRYHYRLIAGGLAIRAAQLLDDNTEELADVLNTAGLWVKDRDEKTGDRYFEILVKRCSKTKLGRSAIDARWFVDEPGPWSAEMRKKFEGETPAQ